MRNTSAVFFTNEADKHTELINMLKTACDVSICSYSSESWNEVDFYSNNNVAFIMDEIPNDNSVSKDAIWILSKLTDDGLFSEIPILFTSFEALYSFESRGFSCFASDVFPYPLDFETVRRRFDNICEIRQLKRQLLNMSQIHTKRILDQASKLKEQNNKMKNINYELVELLVAAIESRDLESGQHIKRIRYFTKALLDQVLERCPEYNISQEQAEYIYYASSVHDVGKIAIPDAIMLKPARLTKEEFDVMKTHTTRGADLLSMLDDISDSNPYFKYCQEICLNHHERWDGKGYPRGLKGDETPISAQIVAVCDCYDALTSHRPYKGALSHEEAVEMIFGGACGAFSQKLMDCFKAALPEFARIENEFKSIASAEQKSVPQEISPASDEIKETDDTGFSCGERIVINAFDVIFNADIDNDRFDILRGDWEKYFPYIPKNFTEAISQIVKVCHPDDSARFDNNFNISYFNKMVAKGKTKARIEFRSVKDGNEKLVIGFVVFNTNENHEVSSVYGAFNIYSQDEIKLEISQGFGVSDALTGLLTQNAFNDAVDEYIRLNPTSKNVMIYIDVDNMSLINSSLGYEYGNNLIKEFANKLRSLNQKNLIICKGPSDKFYLFVENITHQSQLVLFIEKLHKDLRKPFKTPYESGTFTATMGISRYSVDGKDCKHLLMTAEYAATSAKLNGNGAYAFYNAGMKNALALAEKSSGTAESAAIEPRFVPVTDSVTKEIVYYDFVPFTVFDNAVNVNPEVFYDLNKNDKSSKNKSFLAFKTITYMLLGMKTAGKPVPPVALYTLFTPDDISGLTQELKNFVRDNDCTGLDICIMLPQDFVDGISVRRLATFSHFIKECGFSLGLYLVGARYIHNTCYVDNIFKRYVVTPEIFSHSISYGTDIHYDIETINHLRAAVSDITIPGENIDFSCDKLHELGCKSFSTTGDIIVGSEALLDDFNKRSNKVNKPVIQSASSVSEIDPMMFYLDFIRGESVYGIYNINTDSISLSSNVNKVFGFDIFRHISNGATVKFKNLIHPDDIELTLTELAKLKISLAVTRFDIRLIADSHGYSYRNYEVTVFCVVDDKGIPVRFHMIFLPKSES